MILVYQLSSAYSIAFAAGNIDIADSLLEEILVLNPNDEWAQKQKVMVESVQNVTYEIIPSEQ